MLGYTIFILIYYTIIIRFFSNFNSRRKAGDHVLVGGFREYFTGFTLVFVNQPNSVTDVRILSKIKLTHSKSYIYRVEIYATTNERFAEI